MFKVVILFFCSFFIFSKSAVSQLTSAQEIQDLHCDDVYRIIEDIAGNIWIAGSEGVFVYSGTKITTINLDAFKDTEIVYLVYDYVSDVFWCSSFSGEIGYIDSNKKVHRVHMSFVENRPQYFFREDGMYLNGTEINDEGSRGSFTVFKINRKNLYSSQKYSKNSVTKFDHFGSHFDAVHYLNNSLYYLTPTSFEHYDGVSSRVVLNITSPAFSSIKQLSFCDSMFYFLSNNNSILGVSMDMVVSDTIPFDNKLKPMGSISLGADLAIAIGPSGLNIFDCDSKEIIEFPELDKYTIHHVFTDSRGIIWVGTKGQGLIKVMKRVTKVIQADQNESLRITAITSLNDNLFATFSNGELKKLENGIFELVSKNDRIVSKLRTFDKKHFYIIDISGNLSSQSVDKKNIKPFIPKNKLCVKDIIKLKDTIILASSGGLHYYDMMSDSIFDFDFSPRCYSLLKTNRHLIIHAETGLFRADFKNLKTFQKIHLWNDSIFIRSMDANDKGVVWINTNRHGLFRMVDDTIEKITLDYIYDHQNIQYIKCIKNNLWIFLNDDIYLLDMSSMQIRMITGHEGIPIDRYFDVIISGDFYYLASKKSIVKIPTDFITNFKNRDDVFVERIVVNGTQMDFHEALILDSHQKNISIDLNCRNFYNDKKGPFLYRFIENISRDTIVKQAFGTEIFLGQLGSGKYSFQLSNSTMYFDNENFQEVNFTIKPPIYQTWWFHLLTFFFISGGTFFSYYLIQQFLEKKRKDKEKVINDFNELKLKNIQHSLNPHFVNNILNSIYYYIQSESKEKASVVVDRLAVLMREIYNFNKSEFIPLKKELDFIKSFVSLEKLIKKEHIDIAINLSNITPALSSSIKVPSLILQPIVENSIKYRNLNRDLLIQVNLAVNADDLHVEIIDNGQGVKARSLMLKGLSSLELIEERLSIINGKQNNISIQAAPNGSMGTFVKFSLQYIKIL